MCAWPAGAFILGFPISAILDAKYGLRAPMYVAAAVGLLNFVLIVLLVPESLPAEQRKVWLPARPRMHVPCPCHARYAHASACCLHAAHVLSTWYAHALQGKKLDLRSANPLGALNLLLGRSGIMRGSAAAYFLVWLGNACINSQFGNYVNHLFGWGPQESAPLLVPAWSDHQTRTRALARASANPGPNRALACEAVEPSAAPRLSPLRHGTHLLHLLPPTPRAQVLVGVMIAIAPPALVPRLGLKRSIEYGALVYALGLLCTAFAHSPLKIIASTLLTSVGCICIPALVAFIANQAAPAERGALLGALETLQATPPSPGVVEA